MNTKAVKIHTEFYSFLRIQKIAKSNFFHHHKISQIDSTPFYLLFLHNFIISSSSQQSYFDVSYNHSLSSTLSYHTSQKRKRF